MLKKMPDLSVGQWKEHKIQEDLALPVAGEFLGPNDTIQCILVSQVIILHFSIPHARRGLWMHFGIYFSCRLTGRGLFLHVKGNLRALLISHYWDIQCIWGVLKEVRRLCFESIRLVAGIRERLSKGDSVHARGVWRTQGHDHAKMRATKLNYLILFN